jgi:osmotically-inducible protein OsmY
MSQYAYLHRPALLAAAILFAASCSDRADTPNRIDDDAAAPLGGAADTAREAGEEVGGAVGTAGRAGDAAVQTMDVKTALISDDRVDADDINVDTDHQSKTVVLKGTVPTEAQRTIAEEIATRQAEGYRVRNELTIARGARN